VVAAAWGKPSHLHFLTAVSLLRKSDTVPCWCYPHFLSTQCCHVIALSVVPDDPAWDFDAFYKGLEARGAVIYPGKLTDAECFRLGSIGVLCFSPV
jgi:hypothetical protein